jgi:hypothetical protein
MPPNPFAGCLAKRTLVVGRQAYSTTLEIDKRLTKAIYKRAGASSCLKESEPTLT